MKIQPTVFLFAVLGTAFLAAHGRTQAAPIPGLFNTGVDASGAVLPAGVSDPHYLLTGTLSGAFVTAPHNAWTSPPSGSAWITPLPGPQTAPTGDYFYTLTFDLSGFDPATASITGSLSSDNIPTILLNGSNTDFVDPYVNQYQSLASFSITNGFLPGTNVLQFHVVNAPGQGGNPTGLLIANLSGTANRSGEGCPNPSIRMSEVEVCWPSVSNAVYQVDYRSELTTNGWLPLFTNLIGNGGPLCIYDKITAGQAQRFYRVDCQAQ